MTYDGFATLPLVGGSADGQTKTVSVHNGVPQQRLEHRITNPPGVEVYVFRYTSKTVGADGTTYARAWYELE